MSTLKKLIINIFKNGVLFTIKKIIYVRRQEQFTKYYYDRDKISKAIKIGEKNINMFPLNLYEYQKLARAYWKNKDESRAKKTLIKGIEIKYNLSLEEIIGKIEKKLLNKSRFISNNFIFKGGHENYGLIEHTIEEKILLTKILTFEQAKGEFYIKELQQKYKNFKRITPNILSILQVEDLCFITMEKAAGDVPKKFDSNFMERVLLINNTITSVKNSEISRTFIVPSISLNMEPLNVHELIKTFYEISPFSKEVFITHKKYILKNNDHFNTLKIMDYLNNIIVRDKYYEKIVPDKHYSLQHGDFFRDNMILNEESGDLKVIDWGGIRNGPRWVDIAVFLATTKLTFYDIQQNFLNHCDYEVIEKLFFVYILIITWISLSTKEELDFLDQRFCQPALVYIEALTQELYKGEAIKKSSYV